MGLSRGLSPKLKKLEALQDKHRREKSATQKRPKNGIMRGIESKTE